jgi:hypothetical protein
MMSNPHLLGAAERLTMVAGRFNARLMRQKISAAERRLKLQRQSKIVQ